MPYLGCSTANDLYKPAIKATDPEPTNPLDEIVDARAQNQMRRIESQMLYMKLYIKLPSQSYVFTKI